MQDIKEQGWASEAGDADHDLPERQSGLHSGDAGPGDGWQHYRKWISKSPAPRGRRNGLDPSLYTWKGYRTWTEHVKRHWNES